MWLRFFSASGWPAPLPSSLEIRALIPPMTSKILADLPNPLNSLTYFFTVISQHSSLPVWATVVCLVAQLCPTLCNPMDCSPPSFSVRGILQARILECIGLPLPSPEELPNPGIESWFPALQADSLPFELQGLSSKVP